MFSQKRKLQTLIFDWSGTLSDDIPPAMHAANYFLSQKGKSLLDRETFLANAFGTAPSALRWIGFEGSDHELQILYEEQLHAAKSKGVVPVILPNAAETLEYFAQEGVALGLLSSHPTNHLNVEVIEYGLSAYFAAVVGSAHDKALSLEEMVSKMGWDAASTAYVGDMVFDIRAAKKAGVFSIAVSSGYNSKEMLEREEPDLLLDHVGELKILHQELIEAK